MPEGRLAAHPAAGLRRAPGRPSPKTMQRQEQRFTRNDRILRHLDFQRVYGMGRRAGSKGFSVCLTRGATERHRLGLTVPKRVGSAVQRNRVKRRLREAFRLTRCRLPGCYDIVVNARAEVAELPFVELCDAFVGAVRRAARRKEAK